jgi:3-dehydroquinate dehydratase-2
MNAVDALIINPGAFAHYSYAIRDAISTTDLLTIEVHLSDIFKREEFRKNLVISDVCKATISGKGIDGYLDAVNKIKEII